MRQRLMSSVGPRKVLCVIDPPQSGEINMAIDEALLEQAQPDWPIVIRLYRWEQPTLSLGRFQSLEDRDGIPGLDQLPWVRRKTGGGAILHHHEWTYSILIPVQDISKGIKGHSEPLYRAVHLSVMDGLRGMGWRAALSETCTCDVQAEKIPESFLCFSRRSPVDLVIDQYKILGSAQRRTSSGLLQHGSLLLRSSPFTPKMLGLTDLVRDHRIATGSTVELNQEHKNLMRFLEGSNAILAEGKADETDVRLAAKVDVWPDFLMGSLQRGVSELFQCTWETGKLNELLRF